MVPLSSLIGTTPNPEKWFRILELMLCDMLKHGLITPEEAQRAPGKNVITRAVARDSVRLKSKRRMALHNAYFGVGVNSFRHGLMKEARSYFVQAWQKQPRDIVSLAYAGLTWMPSSVSASLVGLKRRIGNSR